MYVPANVCSFGKKGMLHREKIKSSIFSCFPIFDMLQEIKLLMNEVLAAVQYMYASLKDDLHLN